MKLPLTLSLILLVAIVSTSVINYNLSREAIREELLDSSLPLTRDTIFSEVLRNLMRPIFVASTMANDSFLETWALEGEQGLASITGYLKQIQEKYGFFSTFYVSARTNRYYHAEGVLKHIARDDDHDVWFYNFIESGAEFDLDVDTNEAANNTLTIFINFRMEDRLGRLLGVTGVGLRMDMVSRLLKETQERFNRRVFFTDPQGRIQAHSDASLQLNQSIREVEGYSDVADAILALREEPGVFEYDADGAHFLVTARYIPELNWILLVEENESEALSVARMNVVRTVGIGLAAAAVVIFITMVTVKRYQDRLIRLASTDELTGLPNRRQCEKVFEAALSRKLREGEPFSAILADIDGLKRVNDQLGHLQGDQLIRDVAAIMARAVRPSDMVARWGGDEFIVLAHCDRDEAYAVAERIREAVRAFDFTHGASPSAEPAQGPTAGTPRDDPRNHVSLSLGVVEHAEGESLDALTNRADDALYASKRAGRDRVSMGSASG